MNLGATELLIILGILLLFFGGRKLPDLAKSVAESIKEFRKATDETSDDDTATTSSNDEHGA